MPKPSKASAAANAKAAKKPPPHLLTIPLELREHVYTELLPEDASALFQLLLTNHQLSREAKPFTFKQPLAFDGQSELYSWLPRVDRRFLRYVTDVQFKLHDIDPEKIMGALGKRLRQAITAANSAHAPVGNPYDEACDWEIERLESAFSYLPNVKHFTVLPSTDADPRPSYHMLVSFSHLLSRRFPHLVTLTNHEEFLPARFLSAMQNLRRLCFSGMSTSPPAEVTALVRGLPNLVELEINRLDADTSGRQSDRYSRIATSHLCNYAELTRGLSRLESLAFYGESCDQDEDDDDEDDDDDDDDVAEIPEATRIFMGALDGHRSSLQKLQIFANVDASYESRVQKKLATFKTSNLVHLETFHAHFPGFDFLPGSLRTLVLWSSSRDVPFESSMKALVKTARQYRSSVPNLGNILINLDVENWERVSGARHWLYEQMEYLGIRLSWRYWDGFLPK
ncbi:hypothetical protein MMC07_001768 [Pseudocyphellaria aurata]|nr:hypothetical protein [Pseudocyphellaria aurata]